MFFVWNLQRYLKSYDTQTFMCFAAISRISSVNYLLIVKNTESTYILKLKISEHTNIETVLTPFYSYGSPLKRLTF